MFLPPDRKDFVTRLLPHRRAIPSLLTVGEVAEQLRVCAATVYRLCDQGQLPHVRVLHAIRVDPIDLLAFLKGRRMRDQ